MADSRFFHTAGPFTVATIESISGIDATADDKEALITDVAPLDKAESTHITFLDNPKYKELLPATKAKACFLREKYVDLAPAHVALFVTDDPYRAYALTAQAFYPRHHDSLHQSIHSSAVVSLNATLGKCVEIGPGVVIEDHVVLGDNVSIGANSVIQTGVTIGQDTHIGPLCCISHAEIGAQAILHRGVNIGQDGFGFAMGAGGHVKVPQLGRVIIEDQVEIGAGACIDRGAGPDTVIGEGSKIDNLVQIGHNVRIGKHAVIVAQAGIAGSSHIGDFVILAGQAGIAGHITIGPGAKIAAQSGVMNDVPAGVSMGGSPASPVKDWHRQTVALARLAKPKKK